MSRRLPHDWFDGELPEHVQIGDQSWLYSAFAFLHYASRRSRGVRVGHHTGLYNGMFFDLGPDGEVTVGNFCTCVGAIVSSNGSVTIGDYVFIAHEVVIADEDFARPDMAWSGVARARSKPIVIGDDAWIGARAILLGGASVGPGAIVGAGAVVNGPVPPYAIVAGNPARVVGRTSRA